jgi:hypothetical protein
MIDTGKVLSALRDGPMDHVTIISMTPSVEGALIVIYEAPNERQITRTKVACFKHGKLQWTQMV